MKQAKVLTVAERKRLLAIIANDRHSNRGRGFIECHHVKALHTLAEAQTTRLDDLVLLCSNCHRMVHARRPWLTAGDLRPALVA